jgi:hypothetical protein
VRGCGRNTTITPSAPLPSGSASSLAANGSAAGSSPAANARNAPSRCTLAPGPTHRACSPRARPRSTAPVSGGPSHRAQIPPSDSPSTARPPPRVGAPLIPTRDPTVHSASPGSPFGHHPTRRRQPITPNSVRSWKPGLCRLRPHRPQTGHVSGC